MNPARPPRVDVAEVPVPERTTGSGLIHFFPRDPRYRLSGQIPPVAGDIARCGLRKKSDSQAGAGAQVTCVVCLDLCRAAGL